MMWRCKERINSSIAFHDKSLQRKIGVGPLVSSQAKSNRCPAKSPRVNQFSWSSIRFSRIFEKHALHEKGSHRQIGVGPLISNQE